ncbi:Uu.00g028740.m01.CDS01 [Anthostomella pinea]|uniref:Uu.00g028740.m01.CDS01 n=1 Tax=Anthostomella pinea TaxID=933095 RepID=A0AAI8V8Z8_9PEZI|nr:Uu.00g028740.m01.CDS01 [Anthostomella pinea]
MQTPNVYPNVTGPKSVFDSFVVLDYVLTPTSTTQPTFLPYHRLYIWTYEEKLRTLCGYPGAVSHWEWGLDAGSFEKSALFDGTRISMGSDGAKVNITASGPQFFMPVGSRGGLVTHGPFKNYTVNSGPNTAAGRWPRTRGVCSETSIPGSSPDIELFQANLQGNFRYSA